MTLYLLFAGFGTLIYTGVAFAEQAVTGFGSAHVAFALQFAFFLSLLVFLAAVIVLYGTRFLREHPFSVDHVVKSLGALPEARTRGRNAKPND